MAAAVIKAGTVEEVGLMEKAEVAEKSNPLANLWLGVLGLVLGATLLCSAVLMAWPILAQYAAKMH